MILKINWLQFIFLEILLDKVFVTRLVSYNYKNYKRRHNLIENDIPRWQGGTMLLVHSCFDCKICSQNCLFNVERDLFDLGFGHFVCLKCPHGGRTH